MPDAILPPSDPSAAPAPQRLARSTLRLLVGLQLLLALAVAAGVWAASAHLRSLALQNQLSHAQVQTHNLEDSVTQSMRLLHMHLRAVVLSAGTPAARLQQLQTGLQTVEATLPYVRSVSVLDAQGQIIASTQEANLGRRLSLEPLLPQVAPGAPGALRFGRPWRGRDFADGSPWTSPLQSAPPVEDAGFFPVTLVLPDAPQWTLVAAIHSGYFINLARNHQVSDQLQHSVYTDDGTLLFSSNVQELPGTQLAYGARLAQMLQQQVGTAREAHGADTLLVAFRTSRSYPWLVLSQASSHAVLAPWRAQTRSLVLIAVACVTVLLLATGALTRRVQRMLTHEERYLEASRLAASVFAHSSDLIAVTDGQGRVITVNPALEQGLGFSAQELLGRRLGEWIPGQPMPPALVEMWAALGSQGRWQGEVQERRKDGTLLSGWLAVDAIRDHYGQVVNYVGVLRDLSRLQDDAATIRRLSLAVEQSPTSIVITSLEPTIEYGNPEFFRSTGYSAQELLGANPSILQSGQTPAATYSAMWSALHAGQVWHGEFFNRRKDGSLFTVQATIAPLTDTAGRTTHYLGIQQDITARKATEQALRLAASVIAQTYEGVMVCDAQLRIIDTNPAFTRITGYTREEVLGRNPGMLSSGRKNRTQYKAMWEALRSCGHWQGEFWNRRRDGSIYAAASTLNVVCDAQGQVTHYIDVFSDITERKHKQEHLELLAHFDPLTRLPNRVLLADRMAQGLARAQRERRHLGVCFMDLDGFKAVNDTYGHEVGDELLVIVARRLESHVRADDTVARLGGDEFVILFNCIHEIGECERAAARLLAAVREPIVLNSGQHTVQVGASMGITLYPQDGTDADTLLRCADQAMYQAKQAGRNRWVFYTPDLPDGPSPARAALPASAV